jgi:hypothetical protein
LSQKNQERDKITSIRRIHNASGVDRMTRAIILTRTAAAVVTQPMTNNM